MEHPLYSALKVNNEIELCEISDPECKQMIEKILLKERISYYIRWVKPFIFHRNRNICIICVNESAKDAAEDAIRTLCDETGFSVKFLMKKSQNQYL